MTRELCADCGRVRGDPVHTDPEDWGSHPFVPWDEPATVSIAGCALGVGLGAAIWAALAVVGFLVWQLVTR